MASSLTIQEPQSSNLKEVFRHVAANSEQDVINLNRYGAATIVNWYTEHYPEDFEEKPNGQIVFLGGDSTKSSATTTQEEIQDQIEDDDGKLTFKMSDME